LHALQIKDQGRIEKCKTTLDKIVGDTRDNIVNHIINNSISKCLKTGDTKLFQEVAYLMQQYTRISLAYGVYKITKPIIVVDLLEFLRLALYVGDTNSIVWLENHEVILASHFSIIIEEDIYAVCAEKTEDVKPNKQIGGSSINYDVYIEKIIYNMIILQLNGTTSLDYYNFIKRFNVFMIFFHMLCLIGVKN
jgi:hypothetical protein